MISNRYKGKEHLLHRDNYRWIKWKEALVIFRGIHLDAFEHSLFRLRPEDRMNKNHEFLKRDLFRDCVYFFDLNDTFFYFMLLFYYFFLKFYFI